MYVICKKSKIIKKSNTWIGPKTETAQGGLQQYKKRRILIEDTMNPCNKTIRTKTDKKRGTENIKDTMQHILQVKERQGNKKPEKMMQHILQPKKRQKKPEKMMQHILQPKKRQKNKELNNDMQHILQPNKQEKESNSLHRTSQPKAGG